MKQASAAFFEKKEAKKLCLTAATGAGIVPRLANAATSPAPDSKKFFASFFQKRSACLLFFLLISCAAPPPPPPPPVLTLNIIGGANQNPDAAGHGNTVPVRLYQLTATGKFNSTDVYSLMGEEAGTLGADEAGPSEQILVAPNARLTETRPLKPNVSAVGVAVLFRDINRSTWKLTAPAAPNGPTVLTLRINGLTATLK